MLAHSARAVRTGQRHWFGSRRLAIGRLALRFSEGSSPSFLGVQGDRFIDERKMLEIGFGALLTSPGFELHWEICDAIALDGNYRKTASVCGS